MWIPIINKYENIDNEIINNMQLTTILWITLNFDEPQNLFFNFV
jgi:hypothetical protein